jgi:hypothetical protein
MGELDLDRAGAWLAGHGLVGVEPTPLLATRLAARRRARHTEGIMLAVLMLGAGLTFAYDRLATAAGGELRPSGRGTLLVLAALVVALLAGRLLVDGWVRRVDRRAGALLSRRAAHPVQPGWRAVLGRPYAAFTVANLAGATALALGSLAVRDEALRHGAIILLISLAGVAASIVVQLRRLLARPVVAEDEDSLTADVIMRVEDARESIAPTAAWCLPTVLLVGDTLGWWNIASMLLVLVGGVAFHRIRCRSVPVVVVARQAMASR